MSTLRDGLLMGGILFLSMIAFPPCAHAHGGQYRGPEDIVAPPSSGGGRSGRPGGPGPQTGGGPGPRAPGPSGRTKPGSTGGGNAGGAGGRPGRSGARGVQLTDDFTGWEYWWEFNKDPYLRLKEAIHNSGPQTGSLGFYLGGGSRRNGVETLKPTDVQIRDQILPTLKHALDDTLDRDFDIISSCMVAMAKIGVEHPDFRLVDIFRARLGASNQEIRETAALSLGIAGLTSDAESQMDLLVGLTLDNKVGRSASKQAEVNNRTRSFAAYGLGLVAHSTPKLPIKQQAFVALRTILQSRKLSGYNLRVAAVHGMSLLNLESQSDLLDEVVDTLEAFYLLPLGQGDQLIQAHCPTAIAKLIGPSHARANHFKELFAQGLLRTNKRRSRNIQRSCALALGQLASPDDEQVCDQLLTSWHDAKDVQTRYFSLLALGQIGGKANRDVLLKEFNKCLTLDRPWCALALGVYAFPLDKQDKTLGLTLHREFKSAKGPALRSALAIALGLAKFGDAADDIRELMIGKTGQQELAGYLCIGLALMDDKLSSEKIRQVVADSARRPDLLKQAAVALGKLGDKHAVADLSAMLKRPGNNLAKLSAISSALGFIGDRNSVGPLTSMLQDPSLTQLSRAFAAVALGGVADRAPLPWNSKVAVNSNYRANTETLTDGSSGILDIL